MKLAKVIDGAAFTIWAIDLSDGLNEVDCPAKTFLDGLSIEAMISTPPSPSLSA